MIAILRPCVEAPGDRCESFDVGAGVPARAASSCWAGGGTRPYVVNADHKAASRIARPNAICWPAMKSNVVAERIGSIEHFAGSFLGSCIIHNQLDAFMPHEVANDFRVDPRDRFKFPRPIVVIMRPC